MNQKIWKMSGEVSKNFENITRNFQKHFLRNIKQIFEKFANKKKIGDFKEIKKVRKY